MRAVIRPIAEIYTADRYAAGLDCEMPCYSPLKGFVNLETGGIVFKRSSLAGKRREVACGQCLGCRLDRSRMWAARIVHEASLYDDNCFITLTYDDEHMPSDGSLRKKDFQDFMKRLRKKYGGRKIRYYHCGEYGDNYDRPHYHACIFNLQFDDLELFSVKDGDHLFYSEILESLWGKGFCTVGELTFESAAYTARYVTKKVTGKAAQDFYLRCDEYGVAFWLEPEYSTMSRRPGIGRAWYEEFKDDVFPSDEIPVPGSGVFKKVPRYYEQILEADNPEEYEEVKRLRKVFLKEHIEEYSPERLMSKYKVKKAQMMYLTRSFETCE